MRVVFQGMVAIAILASPNGEAAFGRRRQSPSRYRPPVYQAPVYSAPKVVSPTPTNVQPAQETVVRKVEYHNGQTLSVEYRSTPLEGGVGVRNDRRVYAIKNSAGGWNYYPPGETYEPKVKTAVPEPSTPAKPVDTAAALETSQSAFQRYSDYQGQVASAIQQKVDREVTPYVKQDVRSGASPLERNIERNTQAHINRLPGGGVQPLSQIMKEKGLANAGGLGGVPVDDLRLISGASGPASVPTLVMRVDPNADPAKSKATLDNFTRAMIGSVVADKVSAIRQAGLAAIESGKKLWQDATGSGPTPETLRATGLAAPASITENLKSFGGDVAELRSSLSSAMAALDEYKPKVAAVVDASGVLKDAHAEYRKTITGEQSLVAREAEYAGKLKIYEQKRLELVRQGLSPSEIDERLPRPIQPGPAMAEVAGVKGQDGAQAQAPWASGRANRRPGGLVGGAVLGKVMGQVTASIGDGIETAKQLIGASIAKEIYGAYGKIAEEFKKSLPAGVSASVGLASSEEASKALRKAVGDGDVAIQIPLKADGQKSELWLQVPKDGTPGAMEQTQRVARLTQLLMKAGNAKGEPLTKEEADKIVKDDLDREKKEKEAAIREKSVDRAAEDQAVKEAMDEIDSAVSNEAPEARRPRLQKQTDRSSH